MKDSNPLVRPFILLMALGAAIALGASCTSGPPPEVMVAADEIVIAHEDVAANDAIQRDALFEEIRRLDRLNFLHQLQIRVLTDTRPATAAEATALFIEELGKMEAALEMADAAWAGKRAEFAANESIRKAIKLTQLLSSYARAGNADAEKMKTMMLELREALGGKK
jgi:hypothetical protein